MAESSLKSMRTMNLNGPVRLSGVLDGRLKTDSPESLRLRLSASGVQKNLGPELIRRLGILLLSIRRADPESYVKKQLQDLDQMGLDMDLLKALLRSRIYVDFTINNGAGDREMAIDIIRLLKELKNRGAAVFTFAKDSAISAGAYIWMTGSQRYARRNSRFLWHTRPVLEGHSTQEDKNEDLAIMGPFFEQAKEPDRSKFLQAIDSDDQGCHEITTYGETLVRAGLANLFE